jgi:DMSO/TMAO reductase YedYZ molybdopterin-dependent catalytic subunit
MRLDRRKFLTRGSAAASTLLLAGCDRIAYDPNVAKVLETAEVLTKSVQRLIIGDALAPEYPEADLSAKFKANGTTNPQDADYLAHVKSGFADYRLAIGGLVERPAEFSLADLRAMPARTQITRHDCVEGWSCIGKWSGVPLRELLDRAGVKSQARYVVLRCFDDMERGYQAAAEKEDADDADASDEDDDEGKEGAKAAESESAKPVSTDAAAEIGTRYYESIDLREARHPQTILAYEMNGKTLPVAYGAPLRLRVERQLGYKMAKYVRRIDLVESYADIGRGKGGYWEDRGYEWYAGI